jgi:chitin synthase
MEDYLRTVDQDEQKKKREFSARSAEPEADPYSPFSRPAILLANPGSPRMPPVTSPFQATTKLYNHPAYAQTTSTAFLPLVAKDPFADDDDRKTFLTDDEFSKSRLDMEEGGAMRSPSGANSSYGGLNDPDEKVNPALAAAAEVKEEKETVEVYKETRARKQWKFLVWCFTWWIPSPALKYIGGMKRPDVRMAWREKVTIFMLIALLCGSAVFVIAILGNLICPKEYVYTTAELEGHSYSNNQDNMLVSIRGEVFDLTNFANVHYPSIVPVRSVQRYGGLDASNIFPVQVSALCNGKEGPVSPWVTLDTSNTTDPNAVYHDFRAGECSSEVLPTCENGD